MMRQAHVIQDFIATCLPKRSRRRPLSLIRRLEVGLRWIRGGARVGAEISGLGALGGAPWKAGRVGDKSLDLVPVRGWPGRGWAAGLIRRVLCNI